MKKKYVGEVLITFAYAKWKYERAKHLLEVAKERKDPVQENFKGQLSVWQSIMWACCPKHDFSESDLELGSSCKQCGMPSGMDIVEEFQNCDTCEYQESDGGDIVDYGSTKVTTPITYSCTHEQADDASPERMDNLLRCGMSCECKHWKGRVR